MMTEAEAKLIDETLARLADHAERHHALARGAVLQFYALTSAIAPLMLACTDAEVLIKFRAALIQINNEVSRLLKASEEAETMEDHAGRIIS